MDEKPILKHVHEFPSFLSCSQPLIYCIIISGWYLVDIACLFQLPVVCDISQDVIVWADRTNQAVTPQTQSSLFGRICSNAGLQRWQGFLGLTWERMNARQGKEQMLNFLFWFTLGNYFNDEHCSSSGPCITWTLLLLYSTPCTPVPRFIKHLQLL